MVSRRPHPSRGNHERIGLDELEELVDAAIYRRERYRTWYGRDLATWPGVAWELFEHALALELLAPLLDKSSEMPSAT